MGWKVVRGKEKYRYISMLRAEGGKGKREI